jgi:glycerol-3-phosphate acyltransferase PlsX
MGGDTSPPDLVQALQSIRLPSGTDLVLIGTPEWAPLAGKFAYRVATEVIDMADPPLLALRRKKNASLCVGIRMLKEGAIDAFVSAGNTGALVSYAKIALSTLPGVLRPALVALIPTKKNPVAVLDVGANLHAKAVHLSQFAWIGAAYQRARGIDNPRVGLLNIGSEAVKGTSEHRSAYAALQKQTDFHFAGNIEGKSAFEGDVDVLVTDGFTGNVFLKTAEGVASFILDQMHLESRKAQFDDLERRLHYAEYPGALLAGVRGIVIKCHGYANAQGVANGVRQAAELIEGDFLGTLQNHWKKKNR